MELVLGLDKNYYYKNVVPLTQSQRPLCATKIISNTKTAEQICKKNETLFVHPNYSTEDNHSFKVVLLKIFITSNPISLLFMAGIYSAITFKCIYTLQLPLCIVACSVSGGVRHSHAGFKWCAQRIHEKQSTHALCWHKYSSGSLERTQVTRVVFCCIFSKCILCPQ